MSYGPSPAVFRGLTLLNEISSATQLLTVGLNEIVNPRWVAAEPAAAFTCLSSGVERVLKLTYGCEAESRGQKFPSGRELSQRLGHNLVLLEHEVVPPLIASATARGKNYAGRLLTDVQTDPYWPHILKTLDSWAATSGRYRDMTILSGEPVSGDPPAARWNEIETSCINDLNLWGAIAEMDNSALIGIVRPRLALSILKWWAAMFRAWTHGLVGADRQSPGWALSPAASRLLHPQLAEQVRTLD